MTKAGQIIKYVLEALLACALLVYMSSWAFIGKKAEPRACDSLSISIEDAELYGFVTEDEVRALLSGRKGPLGRPLTPALADSIERRLGSISFVKQAQCYAGDDGVAYISIKQREPVLLVKGPADSYYVDSERQIVPASKNRRIAVPIASGRVTRKAAAGEIFDLAEYARGHEFYADHIEQIYIASDGAAYLGVARGVPKIKLGSLDDFRLKLAKLDAWYRQYPDKAWSDEYSMADLSFKGLIYCTRNEKEKD